MAGFIQLHDPAHARQHLIRGEHVSAVEISKADGVVSVFLVGGQTLKLTQEEAKEFLHHFHRIHGTVAHPTA